MNIKFMPFYCCSMHGSLNRFVPVCMAVYIVHFGTQWISLDRLLLKWISPLGEIIKAFVLDDMGTSVSYHTARIRGDTWFNTPTTNHWDNDVDSMRNMWPPWKELISIIEQGFLRMVKSFFAIVVVVLVF